MCPLQQGQFLWGTKFRCGIYRVFRDAIPYYICKIQKMFLKPDLWQQKTDKTCQLKRQFYKYLVYPIFFHRNGFLFTQVSSFQKLLTIAGSDFHTVLEDFYFILNIYLYCRGHLDWLKSKWSQKHNKNHFSFHLVQCPLSDSLSSSLIPYLPNNINYINKNNNL